MAFTDEANFLLKDKFIRSDFRLVDVEFRVGDSVSRQRVSSLVQRQLASIEAAQQAVESPLVPPGVLPSFPPGPPPSVIGPMAPVGLGGPGLTGNIILSRQNYTIRGTNGVNNVVRSSPIVSDGILTRVTGGQVAPFDYGSFDDGIRLLISDSDQVTTVDRVEGDFDLFEVGLGGDPSTSHGIGVNNQVTAAAHPSVDNFDVSFYRSVRAGQRFGVDLNAGGTVDYWAVFEVTQFVQGGEFNTVINNNILESARVDPNPATTFIPIMMELGTLRRVAKSQSEFNASWIAGFRVIGQVSSDGVSLV